MIRHELHIAAPAERVWELTVDVERWPDLTPTMTSVERLDDGPLRVGSRARVRQPRQRPTVWTVTRCEPPHRFEWEATVGWITMTATHSIMSTGTSTGVPAADGCTNVLEVAFSGFGSRVAARLLGRPIRRAIALENEGFRAAAETVDQTVGPAVTSRARREAV